MRILFATSLLALALPAASSAQAGYTIVGQNHWDGMGMSVFFLSDITGDGVPEVGSSAFCTDVNGVNSGSVTIFDGYRRTVLRRHDGEAARHRLGEDAGACGDVDGDGFEDYLAGARQASFGKTMSGSVYVWSGRTGAVLHRFDGQVAHGNFGVSVAGVGDLDGDGRADILVGADKEAQGAGRVRLYSGATGQRLHVMTGVTPGGHLGFSVAGAGDVDGDGVLDVIAGAPLSEGERGRVYVVSGRTGQIHHNIRGTVPGAQFGYSVAAAGDTNLDGFHDVLIGAPCEDTMYLFSGRDGAGLWAARGRGSLNPNVKDGFGHAAGWIGDVDGDGHADVALSAPFAGTRREGAAHVVSGRTGNVLASFVGLSPEDGFGASVYGGNHDVNGDGKADVVIGAPASGTIGQHAPGSLTVRFLP